QRPAEPGRAEAHLPGPEADQLTSPPSRAHPPYSRIRRSFSGPGLGVLGQRVQAALDVATPFFPGAARAIIDMWIEKYVITLCISGTASQLRHRPPAGGSTRQRALQRLRQGSGIGRFQ